MGGRTSLTLYPGMIGMKENAFIDVKNRSSSITAELEIPAGGASGVILAQGGAHSGWSLYVKDGRPAFAYNFLGAVTTIRPSERLPAGPVTVTYDFAYDGGKPGAGGTGTLSVNGKKVGSGRIERTIPFIYRHRDRRRRHGSLHRRHHRLRQGRQQVHRNDPSGADRGHAVNVSSVPCTGRRPCRSTARYRNAVRPRPRRAHRSGAPAQLR